MPIGYTTTIWIPGRIGIVRPDLPDFTLTKTLMFTVASVKMIGLDMA